MKTVAFFTLGCKVNIYESNALMNDFKKAGYEIIANDKPADAYIINTCSVTNMADSKSKKTIRHAKKLNPDAIICVMGCFAQTNPEAKEMNEIDILIGNGNKSKALELVDGALNSNEHKKSVNLLSIRDVRDYENLEAVEFDHTRAFVKIEDGCSNFCSYCIIPYARGRVRSKPLDDLIAEVTQLAEKGYKEIVLTGINLSAFGQDINLHLCDAVEAVCAINGIERVRLGSLEPEQLSEDVIIRLSKQQKLCPQFHLSLQSGCDETLKRMNRHYTTEEYRTIVQNLRNAFDNAAITTDIMVGFPGETEEEFMQSLEFAKEISFSKVHVFAYSQRPGTKACNAPNQITKKVKETRSKQMMHVTNQTKQAFLNQQCGTIQDVLVEREINTNLYEGYTANYTPVQFHSDKNLCGQLVAVHITKANENDCYGIPTTA